MSIRAWRACAAAATVVLVLAPHIALPVPARAQGVLRTTPLFSVTQQHDSNVFSTPLDPEADFVTRVSPGIASEYRTPLWTTSARYLIDLERFATHTSLNGDARHQAAFSVHYNSTSRVTWDGGAELWKTRTPGELNGATGLSLTRTPATRASAHGSLSRRLAPLASARLEYVITQDHLTGGTGATTHDAATRLERRRSTRDSVTWDYRFRAFDFNAAGPSVNSSATSHVVLIGWNHTVTPSTRLSIDAGPRVTNRSTSAELGLALQYQEGPRDLSLSYARTQTTVIGLAGVADTQSLSAAAGWPLTTAMRLHLRPSLFRTALNGVQADAYVLGFDVTRAITRGLALDVGFDASVQRGSLYSRMANPTIARRQVLIRLVSEPSWQLQ
jgi:hypothetical protein